MYFSLLFLCLTLFTGCTTLSPSTSHPISWQERSHQLAAIHTWIANGVIGIRTNQGGGNFSIHWEQTPRHYLLSFYGPMGAGYTVIEGMDHHVVLHSPDQKTFSARTPEQLLASQLGWRLPVSQLVYWIRGLPAPGAAQRILDHDQRLATLDQQGWHLQYDAYTRVDSRDLPARITLVHPHIHVRIVIHQWQIPSVSALPQN